MGDWGPIFEILQGSRNLKLHHCNCYNYYLLYHVEFSFMSSYTISSIAYFLVFCYRPVFQHVVRSVDLITVSFSLCLSRSLFLVCFTLQSCPSSTWVIFTVYLKVVYIYCFLVFGMTFVLRLCRGTIVNDCVYSWGICVGSLRWKSWGDRVCQDSSSNAG